MRKTATRIAREFGEQLRSGRLRRLRLCRRAIVIAGLVGVVGLTILFQPRPRVVWNASASAPIGLYWISAPHDLVAGDMVIAWVPAELRKLAAMRRYIPVNVPLVKRVAAAPGDQVCAQGNQIYINGSWVADRLPLDRRGRPMPWWEGCFQLRDGAVFLLMDDPASFDGRYLGPTDRQDVIGRAKALWTR